MAPLRYLHVIPDLLTSTPLGYPRILDIFSLSATTSHSSQNLHISDTILTILQNHNKSTLSSILNVEKSFRF